MIYLDSSAIVKFVVEEEHSDGFRRHLRRRSIATSGLAHTEVARALRRLNIDAAHGSQTLARMTTLDLTPEILAAAGVLGPPSLRSLDAIHLATAAVIADDLETGCTYDIRIADAAQGVGFVVVAPGRT